MDGPDVTGLTLSAPETFTGSEIKLKVMVVKRDGKMLPIRTLPVSVKPVLVSEEIPD